MRHLDTPRKFSEKFVALLLACLLCSSQLPGQIPAQNPQQQQAGGTGGGQNAPAGQREDLSHIPDKVPTTVQPGDTDGIRRQMYQVLTKAGWNLFQFPDINESAGTVTYGTENGGTLVGHVENGALIIDKTPGIVAAKNQPAQQTQSAPSTAQLAQIKDLAQRRAIQQYLEGLTTNIQGTFRNDPTQSLGTAAWRDPNGNLVSLPHVEALVLIQRVAMQRLTIARLYASQVQSMTPQEQENLINQLRALAADVDVKYQAFQKLQSEIDSVPGGESGVRAKYVKFMNEAAELEDSVPLLMAQGQVKAADEARFEARRLRTGLAGGLYQQFVNARAQYYQALGKNSLLGIQLPSAANSMVSKFSGPNPLFYQVLLQNKNNADIAKLLGPYATQLSAQYTEQIDRLAAMDTVAALWELGGPQYAVARAAAAASGGQSTRALIDALEAAYAGVKIDTDIQKGIEDTAIAMGQALPVAGLAFTAIAIYRDGEDYVVALTDEKNAQAMAGAMGYQGVIEAGERGDTAKGKLGVNIFVAAAQIPGLMSALQTGKNLKVVYQMQRGGAALSGENVVTLAPKGGLGAAKPAAAVGNVTAPGAVAGEIGVTAPAGLTSDAVKGLQKARELGLTDTESILSIIGDADNPKAALGAELKLDNIGNLDKAQASALASGVPQAKIDAILGKAKSLNTVTAYADVPRQLAVAEFEQQGNVILANQSSFAAAQNQFGGTGVKVLQTDFTTDLLSMKTELGLAVRDSRVPNLNPDQLRILRTQIVPRGNDILKWYTFDGQTLSVEPIFDKQFITNLKTTLQRSAAGGNVQAAQLLADLNWNTLETQVATEVGTVRMAPAGSANAQRPADLPILPATPNAPGAKGAVELPILPATPNTPSVAAGPTGTEVIKKPVEIPNAQNSATPPNNTQILRQGENPYAQNPPSGAGRTQILKPGENPNAIGVNVNPETGAAKGQQGVKPLTPNLDPAQMQMTPVPGSRDARIAALTGNLSKVPDKVPTDISPGDTQAIANQMYDVITGADLNPRQWKSTVDSAQGTVTYTAVDGTTLVGKVVNGTLIISKTIGTANTSNPPANGATPGLGQPSSNPNSPNPPPQNALNPNGTTGTGGGASIQPGTNNVGGQNNVPGNGTNPSSCDCNLAQLLQAFHDAQDAEYNAKQALEKAQATANADQDAMSAAGNAVATGKGSQATLDAAVAKSQASQAALPKAQTDYANAQQATIAAEQAYDNCVKQRQNCPPPQNATNQGGSSSTGGNSGPPSGANQAVGQNSVPGQQGNSGQGPAGSNTATNNPAVGNSPANNPSGANPAGNRPVSNPPPPPPPPPPVVNPPAGGNGSGNNGAGGNNSNAGVGGPPAVTPVGGGGNTSTPDSKKPGDFNNAQPYVNSDGHTVSNQYQVTICKGSDYVFPIRGQEVSVKNLGPRSVTGGGAPDATGATFGNGIRIFGKNVGGNFIDADIVPTDGSEPTHISIWVHVIDCNPPRKAIQPQTNVAVQPPTNPVKKPEGGTGSTQPTETSTIPSGGGAKPTDTSAGGAKSSAAGAGVGTGAQDGVTAGSSQNPCPADCDEEKLLEAVLAAEEATNTAKENLSTADKNLTAADTAMRAAGAALQGIDPNSPAFPGLQAQAEAAKQMDAGAVAAQQAAYSALAAAIEKEKQAQQALTDCRNKKAEKNCPPPQNATSQNGINSIGGGGTNSGSVPNNSVAGGANNSNGGGGNVSNGGTTNNSANTGTFNPTFSLPFNTLVNLSSNLFGSAPVATVTQIIVITINVGGAAPAAATSGVRRSPRHVSNASSYSANAISSLHGGFQTVAFHPYGHFGMPARTRIRERDSSSKFSNAAASAEGPSFSISASGNLGRNALEFRVADPSGKIKRIDIPEGAVLEPLKPGSAKPVGGAGGQGAAVGNMLSQQLTAYCLEMAKLPPEPGQLYRIAPQAIQDKFKPVKSVLEAGSKLAAAGQFHPDSDPQAYTDFIRQNALWAKLENWSQQKFTETFIDRTKKNAEHMKISWTNEMENALRNAAPGRWRDISMVLDEAQKLASAAGASNTSQPPQQ